MYGRGHTSRFLTLSGSRRAAAAPPAGLQGAGLRDGRSGLRRLAGTCHEEERSSGSLFRTPQRPWAAAAVAAHRLSRVRFPCLLLGLLLGLLLDRRVLACNALPFARRHLHPGIS